MTKPLPPMPRRGPQYKLVDPTKHGVAPQVGASPRSDISFEFNGRKVRPAQISNELHCDKTVGEISDGR